MNFTYQDLVVAIQIIKDDSINRRKQESRFFLNKNQKQLSQFNQIFPEAPSLTQNRAFLEEEKAMFLLRLYALYQGHKGRYSTSELIQAIGRLLYRLMEVQYHKTAYAAPGIQVRSLLERCRLNENTLVDSFEASLRDYLEKVFSKERAVEILDKAYLDELVGIKPKPEYVSSCVIS